jgi:hypothetical protein
VQHPESCHEVDCWDIRDLLIVHEVTLLIGKEPPEDFPRRLLSGPLPPNLSVFVSGSVWLAFFVRIAGLVLLPGTDTPDQ